MGREDDFSIRAVSLAPDPNYIMALGAIDDFELVPGPMILLESFGTCTTQEIRDLIVVNVLADGGEGVARYNAYLAACSFIEPPLDDWPAGRKSPGGIYDDEHTEELGVIILCYIRYLIQESIDRWSHLGDWETIQVLYREGLHDLLLGHVGAAHEIVFQYFFVVVAYRCEEQLLGHDTKYARRIEKSTPQNRNRPANLVSPIKTARVVWLQLRSVGVLNTLINEAKEVRLITERANKL